MFRLINKDRDERVDRLIARVTDDMEMYGPESEEYSTSMAYLERLHALKAESKPERVSRDTIALVVGNIIGILVIVAYEQKHVMTSKAFGTILKTRN